MLERLLFRSVRPLQRLRCRPRTTQLRPSQRGPLLAATCIRTLHITAPQRIAVTDGADKTTPKQSEAHPKPSGPAPISDDEYHERADTYIESLLEELELLHEKRGDMDVDYSAGVLTVTNPPAGTYVLNKQPPNRQIWLSSPISGPKRFDWCAMGESMHQKEGAGVADWVYLRDGSTLTEILRKELGVDLNSENYEKESE